MDTQKKISLFSALIIVVSTSVGIGCFYIPGMYKSCGLLGGVVISLLAGGLSVLSMKILAAASTLTGADSYGSLFFAAYSEEIFLSLKNRDSEKPIISLPRVFDFLVFLDCIFCIPIFMIVLSDVILPLFIHFGSNDYLFMFNSKTAIISLFTLIFFPICIPPRCFNWIGLIFLSLFSICLCFFSIIYYISTSGINFNNAVNELSNISFDINSIPSYISLFNICIFAFFSQFNIIPATVNLKNPSKTSVRILTSLTGFIIVFSYSILSFLSYSYFGERTEEFLLNSLPHSSPLFIISKLLVAISLFFIIPLHIYPMLEALTNCLENDYLSQINNPENNEQGEQLIQKKDRSKNTTFVKSRSGRILLLTAILFVSCIIGIKFQNNPSSLIIMAGGFVDSIFVFIIPALIHYRVIHEKRHNFTSSPLRLLFSLLYAVSLFGSANTLLNTINFN
ncbi:amino acid permease like integral membrane protein [Cryptosporidium felis]|nr:amino acid permease like integral membrane protein [Cryptosporidium felis]